MPIPASTLKTRYQALVASGNDTEFYRLLNEANERLLFSGRWHWVREPLTLTVTDNHVTLPATHHSIVGARINGTAVGVNWQESEWFEGGPGEFIPVDGAPAFLVDQGLVATPDPDSFASALINPAGDDNNFTLTAVEPGPSDATFAIPIAEVPLTVISLDGEDVTASVRKSISFTGTYTTDGAVSISIPTAAYAAQYNGRPRFAMSSAGASCSMKWEPDADGGGNPGWVVIATNPGKTITLYSLDDVASPELADVWEAASPGTADDVAVTALTATTAREVIDAINAEPATYGMGVSGSLTDGTDAVVFPALLDAGTFGGKSIFTSSSTQAAPDEGFEYYATWDTSGTPMWYLAKQGYGSQVGYLAAWTSTEDVATPDLVTAWIPSGPATGSPVIVPLTTNDAAIASLMTVAASGLATGAVAEVAETPLAGGLNMLERSYKLTSSSDTITEVDVLARHKPSDITTGTDEVLCPLPSAVKQMLYSIVYEESNNTDLSEQYRAKALRELAEHEAAHRGIANRVFKPSMFRPARRRSRHNFP